MAFNDPDAIRALAGRLSDFADALDAWVEAAVKAGDLDDATAEQMSGKAGRIRGAAETLLDAAANYVVDDLNQDEGDLLASVSEATQALQSIDKIDRCGQLVAGVLVLAAGLVDMGQARTPTLELAFQQIRAEL